MSEAATAHHSPMDAQSPPASPIVWAGVSGIVTIAVMRAIIMFSQQLHFDVDPAMSAARFPGMGMAGSLLLDALAVLSAGIVLGGLLLQGGRVRWWLVALVLVGGVIIGLHSMGSAGDAADLWRGSTWFAALFSAVAIAHLPRHDRLRRIAIVILLASIAPMLVRGTLQVTIEHQDTIAEFEQFKSEYLQSRGWAPDSPMARDYERRLRQPNPRGWFETTNILASLLIVVLVSFTGLLISTVRAKLPSGWSGMLAIIIAAAAIGLWLSGSRGAMLAAGGALAVLLLPFALTRVHAVCDRRLGIITLAACIAAMAGVAIRGGVLSESFAGELSLLFRWHYWLGAWSALQDNMLTGVGPGSFQDAYSLHRPARSPEEVVSTHNVFIDWFACLGIIGGVAWSIVLLTMTLQFARHEDHADLAGDPSGGRPEASGGAMVLVVCSALVAGLVALGMEAHSLDSLLAILRLAGLGLMITLGLLLVRVFDALEANGQRGHVRWALGAAALGLLVHSQIEMTFFQPGSAMWAACIVGLLAAAQREQQPMQRSATLCGLMMLLIAAGIAGVIVVAGVRPAWAQQRTMAHAATSLVDMPAGPDARVAARRRCAAMLVDAYEHWPMNHIPLTEAVDQLRTAAALAELDRRRVLLDEACELAAAGVAAHPTRLATAVTYATATYQRAAAQQTDANWQHAVDAAKVLTQMDPHAVASWRRLGDVLWGARRADEAADAYRQALINSDNLALDPLKQLSESDRTLIEQRIGE